LSDITKVCCCCCIWCRCRIGSKKRNTFIRICAHALVDLANVTCRWCGTTLIKLVAPGRHVKAWRFMDMNLSRQLFLLFATTARGK